jgi:predicted Zn finger-like uncharacterized protein
MKFTCDSCSAQYMISDEKVGPGGVKVRCKKCGHVIAVKRSATNGVAAASPATATATASGGAGLDAELGQAFDQAFGDAPAKPTGESDDLGSTQAMSLEDAARVAKAPAPPPDTEWYVAIGQAQVGPLPLSEVKRKWEGGDVGPDSLVWRPGMTDWSPLTTVSELAAYLAPVPQAQPRAARVEERREPAFARAAEPAASSGGGGGAVAAAAADVSWKPAAASALAALASAEIATRQNSVQPAPQNHAVAAPSGVRSLVDAMNLPDGGGVDPTGAIPLPIKGLEPTAERKIERRSSVARSAEEARHRRNVSRAVFGGVLAVILVVGGAAAGVVWYMNQKLKVVPVATAPAPAASAQAPVAAAAPAAAPSTSVPLPPPPAAAQPAVATAPAQPGPVAQTGADAKGEAPTVVAAAAKPEPRVEPVRAAAKPAREDRPARREAPPPPRREPPREETRVAAAPPTPAPEPAPAAPARKKGDSVLDFESNDAALDEALGGGSSPGRSVYVPPRPGGDLPAKLSPAQINEAVAGRIDALRTCVTEQKGREPQATGVLKMRWVISGDGGVRDVKTLTDEYANGQFAQCIGGVIRSIKFPRSQTTGQEVTFPFQF